MELCQYPCQGWESYDGSPDWAAIFHDGNQLSFRTYEKPDADDVRKDFELYKVKIVNSIYHYKKEKSPFFIMWIW